MDSPLRWGVIGPGKIAHRFAQALEFVPDAVLAGAASRDLEKAQAFIKEYGGSFAGDSYQELAERTDIDAVYIGNTHNFHFDPALLCLNAGKAVLCEKPLTVNAAQAQQLVDAARKNNVFLMEALWTRFLPVYQQVQQWIKDGEIGQLQHIHSTFAIKFPYLPEGRHFNPHLAGGILLDGNVYSVAMSQWLLGVDEPETVQAVGVIGKTGVDDSLAVNLDYGGGKTAQFYGSQLAPYTNDLSILGTDGYITVHGHFWEATRVTLHKRGEKGSSADNNNRQELDLPFECNGFEYQIREAVKCIRGGELESAVIPHRHTLANMQLMDTIRQQIGLRYPFEN